MWYLLVCVCLSVAVSVLLKIAKKNKIDLLLAIAINYVVATMMTYVVLHPKLPHNLSQLNWEIFISLGVLLPSIFWVMGRSVDLNGLVKSDAAQRLSLFLPIAAAFLIFNEQLSSVRLIGIVLAFAALICLLIKSNSKTKPSGITGILFLLGVWSGYGVIDILLKRLSQSDPSLNMLIMFILAGILAFIVVSFTRTRWTLISVMGGMLLGVLNFGNIYYYIQAHRFFNTNPTLVFASVNIGVIALATLIGAIVFKEKLSSINIAGLFLAFTAIFFLFYGQILLNYI